LNITVYRVYPIRKFEASWDTLLANRGELGRELAFGPAQDPLGIAAEVADQDRHQKAVLGVAVIGSDARVLNAVLDHILAFMESMGVADLVEREIELIPLGE